MNANADLAAFAETAERLRADVLTPAAIAKATGHAVSTISRDRANKAILDWPARDLVLLLRHCPELSSALQSYLAGRAIDMGHIDRLAESLRQDARTTGSVEQQIRDALSDGRLRACEIDKIRDALAARRRSDRQLDLDLTAARRTAAP